MKTEINSENKGKFFSMYTWQNVFCYGWDDLIYMNFGERQDSILRSNHDKSYLLLKPLSSITDEDFLEVMFKQFPFQPTFKKGKIYHEHLNINQADYLRSKGYALPWMGLSVEEMVEAGWIKLNN